MKIEVYESAESLARQAARIIAADVKTAVALRGRFVMAMSGGQTPLMMLHALAQENLPWPDVHLFQVDERVAPDGDPDRNFTHLRAALLDHVPLRAGQVYAMPVESADLSSAAKEYEAKLKEIAGTPPTLDLVHLGIGTDGHTASLIPGDPVLEESDACVAITGIYQNRRRMTLTYPVLNRARRILWVATGKDKAEVLTHLLNGDSSIPAGRISRDHALILADSAAAAQIG